MSTALKTVLIAVLLAGCAFGDEPTIARGGYFPISPELRGLTRGEFTVEVAFRTTDPGRHILLGNFQSGTNGILNLELQTSNRVRLVMYGGPDRSTDLIASAAEPQIDTRDGAWHHLLGTRSGGSVSLYLDGQFLARAPDATGACELHGDRIWLGRDYRAGATELRGELRHPRLWRRALLPAEIALLAAGRDPAVFAVARPRKVAMGLISDVHYGVVNEYEKGAGFVELDFIRAFFSDLQAAPPDFAIQLGDFCRPVNGQPMLDLWNSYPGRRYHVLGNHERDGGAKFQQVADWWRMPARYYAFDNGLIRALVLDGNEPGGQAKGYASFVSTNQQAWLRTQLTEADRPVVIFIHQPVEALENHDAVRAIIEDADRRKPGLIVAVFSGHLHEDYLLEREGIPYVQINSASYVWMAKIGPVRYADPLWARVEIDFDAGELRIRGRESRWLDKDPWQLGAAEDAYPRSVRRPAISSWMRTLRPATVALAEQAAIQRGSEGLLSTAIHQDAP